MCLLLLTLHHHLIHFNEFSCRPLLHFEHKNYPKISMKHGRSNISEIQNYFFILLEKC